MIDESGKGVTRACKMLYSTVSPDSTQTDAEKQDVIDAKKAFKNEPLDKLEDIIKKDVDNPFEFCKPNTLAFNTYRDRTREAHSANNSPCKPSKTHRIGSCRSVKRARDHDSPVSTLEDVGIRPN